MSDARVQEPHWAAQKERGSFALMKLTALAVRVRSSRALRVNGTSARVRAGTRTRLSAKTTATPLPLSRTVTARAPRLVTDTVSCNTVPGAPSAYRNGRLPPEGASDQPASARADGAAASTSSRDANRTRAAGDIRRLQRSWRWFSGRAAGSSA